MDTEVLTPVIITSVWPALLVFESTLTAYGRSLTLTVTLPSGPEQFLKLSVAAVPILTGDVPVVVAVGTEPVAVDALVVGVLEQVTLAPLSFSTVAGAVALYFPPLVTLTVRVAAASAVVAPRPTARAAVAPANRALPACIRIPMNLHPFFGSIGSPGARGARRILRTNPKRRR